MQDSKTHLGALTQYTNIPHWVTLWEERLPTTLVVNTPKPKPFPPHHIHHPHKTLHYYYNNYHYHYYYNYFLLQSYSHGMLKNSFFEAHPLHKYIISWCWRYTTTTTTTIYCLQSCFPWHTQELILKVTHFINISCLDGEDILLLLLLLLLFLVTKMLPMECWRTHFEAHPQT